MSELVDIWHGVPHQVLQALLDAPPLPPMPLGSFWPPRIDRVRSGRERLGE